MTLLTGSSSSSSSSNRYEELGKERESTYLRWDTHFKANSGAFATQLAESIAETAVETFFSCLQPGYRLFTKEHKYVYSLSLDISQTTTAKKIKGLLGLHSSSASSSSSSSDEITPFNEWLDLIDPKKSERDSESRTKHLEDRYSDPYLGNPQKPAIDRVYFITAMNEIAESIETQLTPLLIRKTSDMGGSPDDVEINAYITKTPLYKDLSSSSLTPANGPTYSVVHVELYFKDTAVVVAEEQAASKGSESPSDNKTLLQKAHAAKQVIATNKIETQKRVRKISIFVKCIFGAIILGGGILLGKYVLAPFIGRLLPARLQNPS